MHASPFTKSDCVNVIVFADVDIAELASNAFEGAALSVRLGELYPDPPLVIAI